MKLITAILFGLIIFSISITAQEVDIPLTVSDGAGSQELRFGLDPTATDGIDNSLGEAPLPPLPPTGVFDARFNSGGESTWRDYRLGNSIFVGAREHEIQYQVGSGTTITISWNFQNGVIGRLQDVVLGTIIDVSMTGGGSYTVSNPGVFTKLKMTINYDLMPNLPAVPILSLPLNGAANIPLTPTLTWNAATDAVTYDIQIARDAGFGDLVATQTGIAVLNYNATGLSNSTLYYWHVRSVNAAGTSEWSAPWSFTTVPAVPGIPVLNSPANNSTDIPLNIAFNWNTAAGAVTYDFQSSAELDFDPTVMNETGITGISINATGLSNNIIYYWRVRAVNAGGASGWSSVWSFTTLPAPPVIPILAMPLNNSTGVEIDPTLSWNAAAGAATYNLQVSTDQNFGSTIVNETGLAGLTHDVSGLSNNTKYFWRVNAVNTGGNSGWSEVWNFTTIVAVPGTVNLLLPENNSTNISLSPVLNWSSTEGAATYELQVSIEEGFGTTVINQNGLTATSYNAAGLASSTKYYWRVRAVNNGGNGIWSPIWNFTTVPPAPAIPILDLPGNDAVNVAVNPTLSWNAAAGAATYELQVSIAADFGTIVINQTGLTATNYNAAGLSNGTKYYWRVRAVNVGGNSDWSATWNFTTVLAVPQLSSPENNSPNISLTPSLNWNGVTGAATYDLQVSTSADFGTTVVNQTALTSVSYDVTGLSNSTIYYWRVRAVNAGGNSNWSNVWNFTTIPLPPEVPVLLFPGNDAFNLDINPTLSWQSAAGAASYNLQVSTDQNFTTTVYNQTGITGTSFTASGLSNSIKYYWKVRAVNAGGNSDWSAVWNFTTVIAAPGVVTLLSPANNSINTSLTPTLSWGSVAGAASFDLQVSAAADFGTNLIDETGLTETSYDVAGLSRGTKYYWRARAVNVGGTNDWSSVWNFTTIPPAPGIPVLVFPFNNATDISTEPLFTWDVVTGAATYDLQASTVTDFAGTVIDQAGIAGISYAASGLNRSTKYYWRLRSVNPGGNSEWSAPFNFTTIPPAPNVPELSSPANNTTELNVNPELSWSGVTGASGYDLQVSIAPGFDSTVLNQAGLTETSFNMTGLLNFTVYYWRVRAVNAGGNSDWSGAWSFTTIDHVAAPSSLIAEAPAISTVVISWMDNSNNESGFNIERKLSNESSFSLLNTAAANSTSYTDNSVEENKIYLYRAKAFNSNIASGYSNQFQILTPVSSIPPPTNLNVAPDSAGNFVLEWEDNSENEDGFIVERLTEGGGGGGMASIINSAVAASNTVYFVPIDTLPANTNSYIDADVNENNSYKYRVMAFGTEGCSIAEQDNNPEPVIPLIAPSDLTTELIEDNSIRLQWIDNSGIETNYIVERKDNIEFAVIATLPANSICYDDMNLGYYKTFSYRICAVNNNSKSAYTNEKEEKTIPVELTSFTGIFENHQIKLQWLTATEKNNMGFEIERSYPAERKEVRNQNESVWEKVGFVDGKGTTTNTSVYLFADNLKNVSSNAKNINYRLKQIDLNGSFEYSDVISVEVDLMPVKYSLSQNYPNPFNPSTVIKFELPEDSHASLIIYNILGDKITTLLNEQKPAGIYEIEFNALGLANGVYFYELRAGNFRGVKKLILLK